MNTLPPDVSVVVNVRERVHPIIKKSAGFKDGATFNRVREVETHSFGDVATEVEVIRINPHRRHGLVVSVVIADASPQLPAARLLPDEDPTDAVHRILREVAGINTVHHEPHFLGYRRYLDRQHPTPTLSLAFLVLGPVPDDGYPSTGFIPVDKVTKMSARNSAVIDHPDTVIQAQNAAVELLETTSISLKLLGEKVTVFTLRELLEVYQIFMDTEFAIDISNFRRKVEAASDFVRPADPPEPSIGRGRPPRWYTSGEATYLDPPIRFRTQPQK